MTYDVMTYDVMTYDVMIYDVVTYEGMKYEVMTYKFLGMVKQFHTQISKLTLKILKHKKKLCCLVRFVAFFSL